MPLYKQEQFAFLYVLSTQRRLFLYTPQLCVPKGLILAVITYLSVTIFRPSEDTPYLGLSV
jgi:hypothetical protein